MACGNIKTPNITSIWNRIWIHLLYNHFVLGPFFLLIKVFPSEHSKPHGLCELTGKYILTVSPLYQKINWNSKIKVAFPQYFHRCNCNVFLCSFLHFRASVFIFFFFFFLDVAQTRFQLMNNRSHKCLKLITTHLNNLYIKQQKFHIQFLRLNQTLPNWMC